MARSARKNNFKVTVEGAKELDKFLEGMGDDAGRLINAAVKEGGEIPLKAAKANAPVDTGKLQRNIVMQPVVTRAGRGGRRRRIQSGSVKIGFNRTRKGAEDDAYYGSFVELGTKKQPARYYLRDAVDKNKEAIANAITSAFKRMRGR